MHRGRGRGPDGTERAPPPALARPTRPPPAPPQLAHRVLAMRELMARTVMQGFPEFVTRTNIEVLRAHLEAHSYTSGAGGGGRGKEVGAGRLTPVARPWPAPPTPCPPPSDPVLLTGSHTSSSKDVLTGKGEAQE